ncbi:protein phosphatase 1 regulatory subunit 3B-like [Styela clava]
MSSRNTSIMDLTSSVKDRLQTKRIALQNVYMRDESKYGQYVLAIMGNVQVANLFYEKYVFARVTFDNWATYEDFNGSWLKSGEGTDIFTFGFTRRDKQAVEVEFALCCVQGGIHTWDNNNGENYSFKLSGGKLIPSSY